MSWKIRRAHYYARQKGTTGADPDTAKFFNFLILLGLILILIMFMVSGGNTDNSIVGFFGLIGLISLFITPFLIIFGLIGGTFQHGLPDFGKNNLSKKQLNDQGEITWNQWIEEDRKKRNK